MKQKRKTVVITGSNRGIGFEIAKLCIEKGYFVVLTYRNPENSKAVQKLQDEYKTKRENIIGMNLDISSMESIEKFVKDFEKLKIKIDVLVNNASILIEHSIATYSITKQTIEINFFGTVNFTEKAIPLMKKGGRIVFLSSQLGQLSSSLSSMSRELKKKFLTSNSIVEIKSLMSKFVDDVKENNLKDYSENDCYFCYGMSKMGINSYCRAMSNIQKDILFFSSCPGWCRTRMGGRSAPRSPKKGASDIFYVIEKAEKNHNGKLFSNCKVVSY